MKNPLQRGHLLTIKNEWYKKICTEFWQQQLAWDGEDLTGNLLEEKNGKAIITAKSNGILAGREECEFFAELENFSLTFYKKDGEKIETGEKLCELSGNIQTLLQAERTLLNVLSRLSGIATMASEAMEKMNKNGRDKSTPLLCPTRKTLWGPIDKKGVVVAGGGTHRLGLFDAILLKENHLLPLGGVTGALRQIQNSKFKIQNSPVAFWEIEVETEDELQEALENLPEQRPGVIMLDNFSPEKIKEMLDSPMIRQGELRSEREQPGLGARGVNIFFEASGGITLQNISDYSETGVDAISAGFLTNAVIPVDYSMRII